MLIDLITVLGVDMLAFNYGRAKSSFSGPYPVNGAIIYDSMLTVHFSRFVSIRIVIFFEGLNRSMISDGSREEMRTMMNRRAFFSAVLSVFLIVCLGYGLACAGAPPKAKKPAPIPPAALAGTRFGPDMLMGYEEVGGGLISDQNRRMTDWAIQFVRRDGVEMAWLCRVVAADPTGRPIYQITDVLKLPGRKKGEILTWFACCYGGRRNDAIIAYTDKYYYRVIRTWLANRQTGKIEEVSTRGIVCQDPAVTLP
jgi:hypothetical protein